MKIAAFLKKILRKVFSKIKIDKTISDFLISSFTILYYLWTFYAILKYIGISGKEMMTFLGTTGIISAVAFRDSLSTIASTVMILTFKPFKIGNIIECENFTGKVEKINLFYTRIKTQQNEIINIPNRMITDYPVKNFSKEKVRRIDFFLSVPYSENINKVKAVLEKVIKEAQLETKDILKVPAYTVGIKELKQNYVKFFLYVYVKAEKYQYLKTLVSEKIKIAFDLKGIKFSGTEK